MVTLSQCLVRIVSVLVEQVWSILVLTLLAKAVTISSEKLVTRDFAIEGLLLLAIRMTASSLLGVMEHCCGPLLYSTPSYYMNE